MARTKYFNVEFKTKAQFKAVRTLVDIGQRRKGKQHIVFAGWNEGLGRLTLNNYYKVVRNGVNAWEGYKVIILWNGEVVLDKEFETKLVGGKMTLVRPASFDMAA